MGLMEDHVWLFFPHNLLKFAWGVWVSVAEPESDEGCQDALDDCEVDLDHDHHQQIHLSVYL